ncbi:MAG: hypothetical protein ACOYIP_01185 [Coriobacteriales bacterium]|jgi:hypothetical protein
MDERGISAWLGYIMRCRKGETAVDGLGEPAVVRGWIATMEVELVSTGALEPEELAPLVERDKLIVQYCFRSQEAVDQLLRFAGAEEVEV